MTFCDPMDCSMPGSSVSHYLPEFAQIQILSSFTVSFIHNSIYSFLLVGLAFRHIYQSQAQQELVPPSFLNFFLLNHSNQVQKVKVFLRNQLMVFMSYVVTPKTSRQGNISAFLE